LVENNGFKSRASLWDIHLSRKEEKVSLHKRFSNANAGTIHLEK